jgi:hypothetical protein
MAASAHISYYRTPPSGTALLSVVADDAKYKHEQQK